jgi:hypothetical protein
MAVGVTSPAEIQRQVRQWLGSGLQAACIFLSARIKETLSVPAPRLNTKDPYTGLPVTIAASRAIPGAPPRKLTGDLRRSHAWEMNDDGTVGRVGTNKESARQLEEGGFIRPVRKSMLRWLVADITTGKPVVKQVFSKGVYQAPHPSIMPTFVAQKENLGRIIGPLSGA